LKDLEVNKIRFYFDSSNTETMTTRSSIQLRADADSAMNNLLQTSIKHTETIAQAKALIDMKEEKIQLLLGHMRNLFNILHEAFDSDESIFVDDELREIVDAIKTAGIINPDILQDRRFWVERMNEQINKLPY
jgi:hypothetical protein